MQIFNNQTILNFDYKHCRKGYSENGVLIQLPIIMSSFLILLESNLSLHFKSYKCV